MSMFAYSIIAVVLALAILYGLHLMSNVKKAVRGNAIAASAMALAIIITMFRDHSMGDSPCGSPLPPVWPLVSSFPIRSR